MYRNINSLVTSHFGRGFFDGKQMINVSICRWYSLIDRKERATANKSWEERARAREKKMRMIHFSKPFFFVTITKRLRVIHVYMCECISFYKIVCLLYWWSFYFSLSLCSSVLKVLVHLHLCCQSVFYFCFLLSVWKYRKFQREALFFVFAYKKKRNIVIYLWIYSIEHIVTLYVLYFWVTYFVLSIQLMFLLYSLGLT